jgi:hypothetical protein
MKLNSKRIKNPGYGIEAGLLFVTYNVPGIDNIKSLDTFKIPGIARYQSGMGAPRRCLWVRLVFG